VEIAATHNYRCRKEVYDSFRDTVPRSVLMRDMYSAIFDAIIKDNRFQKLILKEVAKDIFATPPAFTWIFIKSFSKKKRKEINRALKILVEDAREGRSPCEVSMTTIVTTAFRLLAENKYKLAF